MAKKNKQDVAGDEAKNDTPTYNEGLPADEVDLPKKPPFCSVTTDQEGTTHFTFGNGEAVSINPSELSEEQQRNLMYHGLVQKCRDSFSSAKGDFAFGIASVTKVVTNLRDDKWTASRETGESKPKIGELVQALANLKGMPVDVVQAAVEKASDEKRKVWRKNGDVAAEILRIRAENARARAEKAATKEALPDLDEAA